MYLTHDSGGVSTCPSPEMTCVPWRGSPIDGVSTLHTGGVAAAPFSTRGTPQRKLGRVPITRFERADLLLRLAESLAKDSPLSPPRSGGSVRSAGRRRSDRRPRVADPPGKRVVEELISHGRRGGRVLGRSRVDCGASRRESSSASVSLISAACRPQHQAAIPRSISSAPARRPASVEKPAAFAHSGSPRTRTSDAHCSSFAQAIATQPSSSGLRSSRQTSPCGEATGPRLPSRSSNTP